MANYDKNVDDFSASNAIKILKTEDQDKFTVYVITVSLGPVQWTVKHRYSEFYDLNEKLVNEFKIAKNLLPPKKYFGNQSEEFIRRRQKELGTYLQTILRHFVTVPHQLSLFLHFNRYEIHGISQELAEQLYHKGDEILAAEELFHTTTLHLYSVCTRLKLAEPTCDSGDAKKDIGHILDFFTRLKLLFVEGQVAEVGHSNIVPNSLAFDFTCFKNLKYLKLESCNPSKISGVETIKKTLTKIDVHRSLKALKEVLLVDMGYGQWLGTSDEAVLVPAWHSVTTANFSRNQITYIDESVKLLPRVKYLDLSHNKLQAIQELQHLPDLTHVDLSHNILKQLVALHTKFGNIKHLNLAGNQLESLHGFSKLYSLESLNVSKNEISQVLEVQHLTNLPCLEKLNLRGNPVTIIVDYRVCVLELFLDRASEVTLDGETTSSQEMSTINVRVAMLKSKRLHEKKHKLAAREASISEPPGSNPAAAASSSQTATLSYSPAEEAIPVLGTGASGVGGRASARPGMDSGTDYAREIEAMRAQGGEDWLAILNRKPPAEEKSVDKYKEKENDPQKDNKSKKKAKTERAHSYRYHYEERPVGPTAHAQDSANEKPGVKKIQTEVDSCSSSSDYSSTSETLPTTQLMTSEVGFLLPESMPTRNDTTFMEQLQVMTPDTQALGRRSGVGTGSDHNHHREERPVHLMWAPTICYTNPYKEFPTCVYISTENIHIYQVKALTSGFEIPDMRHLYCIPLMSVQQIALGYQNLTIRVEEAFVGPQGTFTFLTGSAGKTDLFLDSLKLAYRRAVPDLDQYEDPHIILNEDSELNLRTALSAVEKCEPSDVCIELYMLVYAKDSADTKRPFTTHSLVISSRYLYLLREDYVLYPKPTFSIGTATKPQFEIVSAHPLNFRTSGFTLYDSDAQNPQAHQVLTDTFSATNTSAMLSPNFIGYGVKLTFENSFKLLDIRVPTPSQRSRFLEALTQSREKLSTSPSKSKLSNNRSSDSSNGSAQHLKGPKSKKKKSRSPKPVKNGSSQSENQTSESDAQPNTDIVMNSGARPKTKKIDENSSTKHSANKIATFTSTDSDTVNSLQSNPDVMLSRGSPAGESAKTIDSLEDQRVSQLRKSPALEHMARSPIDIYGTHSDDIEQGYLENAYSVDSTCNSLETDTEKNKINGIQASSSLNASTYPSLQLLNHLTHCNEEMHLMRTLSEDLLEFSSLTGEEILNYFHSNFAQIGLGDEELRHLQWTEAIPYVNPRQIVNTCMLLSSRALYLVSDDSPKANVLKSPWKKHIRNRSDMTQFVKTSPKINAAKVNAAAGILQKVSTQGKPLLKAFVTIPLDEIKSVEIGLFDQSFRITCDKAEKVYCFLTRNALVTEAFVRQLMSALNSFAHDETTTDLKPSSSGNEQDFYKMFYGRNYYRAESLEFVHPSKVRFIYPQDDVIQDVTYLVLQNVGGKIPSTTNILMYILCYFQFNAINSNNIEIKDCDSRTLVLTENHVTLIAEDCVSYPLPDFAKQPPLHKQHEILQVRSLEYLKRVVVSDFRSHDVTLVFSDESDDVKVDVSLDYYSPGSGAVPGSGQQVPEVTWSLALQCMHDKDKLIKLISRQWSETHGKQLSVQVST